MPTHAGVTIIGLDPATLVLLILLIFLTTFAAIAIFAMYLTGRLSTEHKRLNDDLKEETARIQAHQAQQDARIYEGAYNQTMKDLFQTISQGQAALWSPKKE